LIDDLTKLLEASRRVVVFTGAGISTESGIPDFRSPGGFWSTNQPIYFNDFLAWEDMRREAWRRKLAFEEVFKQAQPNRGHRAIAHLVSEGKVTSVITQNIDGLHQLSGVPDQKVVELHGNSTYAVCLTCARRYELAPVLARFSIDEQPPECECGGFIKTATISFGQPMPTEAMQAAKRETEACDLFLAVGSSLVVYPAAGFPGLARQCGARLVIVNRDPTDLDYLADLVLHTEIGETLGAVTGVD
jgi:NAD-dependent protein deacetylase/lipoamidase